LAGAATRRLERHCERHNRAAHWQHKGGGGGRQEKRVLVGNPDGSNYRSRRLLNQEFIQALLLHFRNEGKRAIQRVAKEQPGTYVKILALLVPREMRLEHANPISGLSDEQLDKMIDYLQQKIARCAAGGDVKLIDGRVEATALEVPVLEPPKRRPNRLMMEADTAVGPRERKPRKRVPSPAST
jgi:hypothetical protein